VEPRALKRQDSLDFFAAVVTTHFDRFIPSHELMNRGPDAPPQAIAGFPNFVQEITPRKLNSDVLLLPPSFQPCG
jgi:hypothetical protein